MVNFVFVILTVIALPFGRFETMVTLVFGAWSAFLILSKMLYQLSIADNVAWSTNCSVSAFAAFCCLFCCWLLVCASARLAQSVTYVTDHSRLRC